MNLDCRKGASRPGVRRPSGRGRYPDLSFAASLRGDESAHPEPSPSPGSYLLSYRPEGDLDAYRLVGHGGAAATVAIQPDGWCECDCLAFAADWECAHVRVVEGLGLARPSCLEPAGD